MSPTKKATTPHGEVEYETVECASCGNQVAKPAAKRFVVGDIQSEYDWGGKAEYNFIKSRAEGWACSFCWDDPAGFPEQDFWKDERTHHFIAGTLIRLLIALALFVVLV